MLVDQKMALRTFLFPDQAFRDSKKQANDANREEFG
jgi:hypothetical protein